jgi:N-acetylglucosaminyldiphosphoundecaprenol N-acetyl-beta-D-mannosaminyltransferase
MRGGLRLRGVMTVSMAIPRSAIRAEDDSTESRVLYPAAVAGWDDFCREVYCFLGIPIDAIEMPELLRCVNRAAACRDRLVIATSNLNYLVKSLRSSGFRQTLFESELSTADGTPIVWIARILGLPIKHRVAGSDMFEELNGAVPSARELKVFLFGGAEGVAQAASTALNEKCGGVTCVGCYNPGCGTIEEMSQQHIIDQINQSGADFLVVSLGADKGQRWLQRNRDRLTVPVRAHLGATVNYAAKTLKRAPRILQITGLEWLWRIKEEPRLWVRYFGDGMTLLALLLVRILPLAVLYRWQKLSASDSNEFSARLTDQFDTVNLELSGAALASCVEDAIPVFRRASASNKKINLVLSDVRMIDARFFGLILMLKKNVRELRLSGVTPNLKTAFRLHGLGCLL